MTVTVDVDASSKTKMNGHINSMMDDPASAPDPISSIFNTSNPDLTPPLLNGSLNNSLSSDCLDVSLENEILSTPDKVKKREIRKTSPDLFDDSSPSRNISRYGRTRKQKLIADFYVEGSAFVSPKNGSEKSTSKSPPSKNNSLIQSNGLESQLNGSCEDNMSTKLSTAWNASPNKIKLKVYSKKDLVQKKDKEETATLMFNMFSPIKSNLSPEKNALTSSPQPLDIIVLKKSPKGEFQCSPKKSNSSAVTALNFGNEGDCNGDSQHRLLDISEIKEEFIPSVPINNNMVADECELSCPWKVGELAWARVGSHPWWPCLITRDTVDYKYVRTKSVGRGAVSAFVIHVTFFADNGRHSWLLNNFLMKFEGLENFYEIKKGITTEMKKKDPKYCSSFEVKSNKQVKWLSAVSEAEMLLRRPLELREEFLYTMFLSSQLAPKKRVKQIKKEKPKPTNGDKSALSESLFDSLFATIKTEKNDEESEPLSTSFDICTKNKKQSSIDKWIVKSKHDSQDKSKSDNESNVTQTDIVVNGVKEDDEKEGIDNKKISASTPIKKRKRRTVDTYEEQQEDDSNNDEISTLEVAFKSGQKESNLNYEDPGFQQYLENLRDEHPELDEDKLLKYANETWKYSDNEILNEMKNVNSATRVKGLEEDILPVVQTKKLRRTNTNETNNGSESPVNREKLPRRKSVKSYLCEESSDESEDEFLPSGEVKVKKEKQHKKEKEEQLVDAEDGLVEIESNVSQGRVDVYMESLKFLKPNIFKGLSKEKVCEICELPSNLLKCKGPCQGMFHNTCVQLKNLEPVAGSEAKTAIKKKKRRGKWKNGKIPENVTSPKTEIDSNQDLTGCEDSDENKGSSNDGKDVNGQIDDNQTFDDLDFEEQISKKMLELINDDTVVNDDNASISSLEDDWTDVQPGECVIRDVIKTKKQETVSTSELESSFKCNNCVKHETPLCFICRSEKDPKGGCETRQRCGVIHCHQYYHIECLKEWPQTKYMAGAIMKGNKKINTETIFCPRHVCHTCVSDDPQGCKSRFAGDKLARCVKCPATYHSFTQCVPAGTKIITASQVVCPRHLNQKSGKISQHVNAAWCFICAKGGMLVCCETCPTSFHAECLNIPLPEGGYICEDCETGRLPLYEELVWVKLGQYRWWPALVLHPADIPPNIHALSHTPGQFAVRFFGIYDHYWINSGRVFPYQEGDTGHTSSRKSSVDNAFLTAVKQAKEAYSIIKSMKEKAMQVELHSRLLPPKYVKLKVNRAIGGAIIGSKGNGEASKCDCNPDSENPCAPDTDCLNRMLLTECSPDLCSAGERCCNQSFEKRQYPLLEPSRTSHRGWGLKTLVDIKKGQFVIEYVGEVIDEAEFQRRMKIKQEMRDENYYFLTLDKDRMIDAGPKGNVARFMNHSCEPNCETQKWTVNGDTRVGLFALVDIPSGSEITFNYNLACAGDDKKKCLCGAKRCAGYIGAKPKQDDPVPKKPKKIKLKRKYRKRAKNPNVVTNTPKTIAQIKKTLSRDIKGLSGIDKDVELINRSLIYCNDNDKDSSSSGKEVLNAFEELCNAEYKTDIKVNPNINSNKKEKGVKRKRSIKLHLRTKSNDNCEVVVKRTRSNSLLHSEESKVDICETDVKNNCESESIVNNDELKETFSVHVND